MEKDFKKIRIMNKSIKMQNKIINTLNSDFWEPVLNWADFVGQLKNYHRI